MTASTSTWRQVQDTATRDLTVWRAEREFRPPLPSYAPTRARFDWFDGEPTERIEPPRAGRAAATRVAVIAAVTLQLMLGSTVLAQRPSLGDVAILVILVGGVWLAIMAAWRARR